MISAIEEAKKALALGEIPVGAVIVKDGEIIARGHNLRETRKDPVCHAEIEALRRAAQALGDWRLNGCGLYVTLEPCAMCAGAILNARVGRVVFGAYDKDYGAAGGKIDLFASRSLGGKTAVFGGIMERECAGILNEFFQNARK